MFEETNKKTDVAVYLRGGQAECGLWNLMMEIALTQVYTKQKPRSTPVILNRMDKHITSWVQV